MRFYNGYERAFNCQINRSIFTLIVFLIIVAFSGLNWYTLSIYKQIQFLSCVSIKNYIYIYIKIILIVLF